MDVSEPRNLCADRGPGLVAFGPPLRDLSPEKVNSLICDWNVEGVVYALRVSPAVTRLTLYRRPQVCRTQPTHRCGKPFKRERKQQNTKTTTPRDQVASHRNHSSTGFEELQRNGAKHCPPGHKFQKSEVPPVAGAGQSEIHIPKVT